MKHGQIPTPYFVIDETRLRQNLEQAQRLKALSGARLVLALKCFSTWGVFPIIAPYLDGTTSSSPYEVRLGYEHFGGETHAYSVGFSSEDIEDVLVYSDKIIFNSLSQFSTYRARAKDRASIGLRLNPGISYAHQDLANPARQYSRLGVPFAQLSDAIFDNLDGAMVHMNCENTSVDAFIQQLETLKEMYAKWLKRLDWLSLGGGVLFTWPNYDLDKLAQSLVQFSQHFGLQIYLEPGEAIISRTTDLIVRVVDIVDNGIPTAIVDSATEAHRLDTLIYNEPASIKESNETGKYHYIIGSCSCLAGDNFGEARFDQPLHIGQKLHISDSGGYTMVKLNWFNGLRMPSVYCQRLSGKLEKVNEFHYTDFRRSLSQWVVK